LTESRYRDNAEVENRPPTDFKAFEEIKWSVGMEI
jgi:hypothetical protein